MDRGEISYTEVAQDLITILSNASVKNHNRKLFSDTAVTTIKAAASRSSIHGARKRMRKGRSRRQIARVLEGLDLEGVTKEVNLVLRADARRKFGGQTLSLAFDIHAISYHGRHHKDEKELGRGKQKDGTTKFHMMATAYVVGKKRKRFTLAVVFVPRGTTMRAVVQTLISLLRRCGIKVDQVLLDKGFYAIEVVRLLMRLNIGFIIPMRGRRLEKRKGSYQTAYCMKSVIDGKPAEQLVNAVSVIKYNRGKRFKDHGAMQLCFITYRVNLDLREIAERYRKRFGIESSYKLNKAIRPRTSSRNPAIRMFLFSAAVFIQNIWVEVKLLFCKWLSRSDSRMITLRDFADILLSWIRRLYGENTEVCMAVG
jgi:putative transposase